MAKSVASTSVQDLIQQGLSPEEIREKALAYRAAGKVLWGWPEYCFLHFYTSGSSTFRSDIAPIATIGPVRVQPSMPKLSTIEEATNRRVEEQLREIDNWEMALCGDCGVDDTSRVIYYIRRLTPAQRQAILARYKYGLTNDQVAARYGISVCTVSGHISAARKSISAMHKERKEWRL